MERKTGEHYSWDRIDRIREAVESYKVESDGPPPPADGSPPLPGKEGSKDEDKSPSHGDDINPPKSPFIRGTDEAESGFGGKLKEFVEELFEANKIAEGRYIKIKLGPGEFHVNRKIVKDIVMIIVNYARSYEYLQESGEETEPQDPRDDYGIDGIYRYADDTISRANSLRIAHIISEKISEAFNGYPLSVKEIKELYELNTYYERYLK
jgi:hypothetical protein